MENKSTASQSITVRYNSPDCMRMMLEMQMKRRRQLALKATSTASARPSSETGDSQKSPKTPLAIYRPPENLHQENKNVLTPDTNYNRQPFCMTTSDKPVVYPKPRLVDSELLDTSTDCDPVEHPKSRRDHTELALADAATACAMPSSRAGRSQKSTKPTLAIYRPPGARLAELLRKRSENVGTSDTDHNQRQLFSPTISNSQVVYPKPGKAHSEVPNAMRASLALCCAPDEPEPIGNCPQSHSGHKQEEGRRNGDLIEQAMSDPASLNPQQLVHLARVVCHTAAKTAEHAEPAAEFCYKLALVSDRVFLEGLLSGCRELFAMREELMAPLKPSTDVAVRWKPYVSFLAQLLVAFVSSDGDGATAACDTVETRDGKRSVVISKNTVRSLAILLDCCFRVILRPPSLDSFDQMECLKSAMTAAGKAMEKAEPYLMQAVMSQLHDAYDKPGISEHSRKVLLELIELHASGWQFKSSTQ
ncbi:uncharacterized protein [Dermacentor albipictus]|uniref:uncharacterized protein isoform X3 n=1 Tax=Dermacentor albipictus TaxID=60249 RepID=UPI0031FBDAE5